MSKSSPVTSIRTENENARVLRRRSSGWSTPSLGLGEGPIADDDVKPAIESQLRHVRDGLEIVGQVGIGENPARAPGDRHPRLESGELSPIVGQPNRHEPGHRAPVENLGRAVGRAVVDDDDLGDETPAFEKGLEPGEAVGEKALAVEDRNHQRHGGACHGRVVRDAHFKHATRVTRRRASRGEGEE